MAKHIVVIGAGFGGMSAAAYLAKAGYKVTVVEKNSQPGGRAAVLKKDGYIWDLGPSWYMMPDVFDEFFADFGKKTSDYYKLKRLDPSYRVFDNTPGSLDIGDAETTALAFDTVKPGSGKRLKRLLGETGKEYDSVRKNILTMDWLSKRQALRPDILRYLSEPKMVGSYDARISQHIKDPRLKHVLEFMTVFMGGSPHNVPGMYSLLTHVDMGLGIWYPVGGFGAVAKGFEKLCKSLGVKFIYNFEVAKIITLQGKVSGVRPMHGEPLLCDAVVANADYHHVQTTLLGREEQDIPDFKWPGKTLSPSGLVICIGLKKQAPDLLHHNLFFDTDWNGHFDDVFRRKRWSEQPLFYLCVPSKTDSKVAPKGHENLFVLAPQANGDQPDDETITRTVDNIISRIEKRAGVSFKDNITSVQVLAHNYFKTNYNAYRGNAFGLAHTLNQSALFRPRLKAKKVNGLYFAGQYTNPGTGVPMVVLSGKTVARVVGEHE